MMLSLAILWLFAAAATAAPLSLGISFGTDADALPTLTLPYATYQAYSYDSDNDYYYFKNIRFAAPPVGDLRWAMPAAPETETEVQDGTVGNQCLQAVNALIAIGYPILESLEPASEDCLFLDIKVPGEAVRGEKKDLPVLFWIFGGGYILGSKSFVVYDGAPYLDASNNSLIYVATNYRLGAFGFLNGPTVQDEGVPNVALHDQRAAMQWVQDYIGLLGGDPTHVTAMGESAGAGSIMHHLVAESGTLEPLFNQAIIMSPAFQPMFDQPSLETQYVSFAEHAGCTGQGLDCLRNKTSDELQAANLAVTTAAEYGTFGFGPAVDNQYIKDLPQFEFGAGNYWKNMTVLLGHMANEGILFTNPTILTNIQAEGLLSENFPNATAAARTELEELYPVPSLTGEYQTEFERLETLIGEWAVTCNNRFITDAYLGNVYSYQFSTLPGIHGEDLLLAFWRTDFDIGQYIDIDLDLGFLTDNNLATAYQHYLTSFVLTGTPDTYRQLDSIPATINWTPATESNGVVTIFNIDLPGFSYQADPDEPADRCAFWQAGGWAGKNSTS